MKFKIHRGAKEIGGNCIEVESQGKRLFLDFGMPLILPEEGEYSSREIVKKDWKELIKNRYLPNVEGLYKGNDDNILGILISHAHQDHYGFAKFVSKKIPFFIGKKAKKLVDLTVKFTPMDVDVSNSEYIQDRFPFSLGPFKITPYLVDHSAFDAYAFLIEADGKKFFYSGDFRAHGRKYWAFPKLIKDLPKDIDVMMIETTMVGRDDGNYVKEEDLEEKMVERMKSTKGLVFFEASAQNIDRIVTAYRAATKSGRIFVMDGYTACVYKELGEKNLPQDTWENVKVYFNKNHIIKSMREGAPDELIFPFKNSQIKGNEIAANPEKYVMMFRQSMITDFSWANGIPESALKDSSYIFSQWGGYWDRMDKMKEFIKQYSIDGHHHIHCSGHAYVSDLKKLVDEVKPNNIVPIHGFETDAINKYCNNVLQVKDGIWEKI